MILPMLAVERDNGDFSDGARLQAAHINAVVLRMGSRNIERLDAADLTKEMFGDSGVECIGRKRFLPLEEPKPRPWNDEMKKTRFTADRAIAFDRFYVRFRLNLESYPAAMASTAVLDHVSLARICAA
jgi:hypothetical protein